MEACAHASRVRLEQHARVAVTAGLAFTAFLVVGALPATVAGASSEGDVRAGQALAPQTITFPGLSDVTFGEPPITLRATASSGLAVRYAAIGSCTVEGSTATVDRAGSCTVTASQAGDAEWDAAEPVSRTFAKASASLSVDGLTPTYTGSPLPVDVTTDPADLPGVGVVYQQGAGSPSTSAPTGAGTYMVRVTLANGDYAAAPVDATLRIAQASQTITFDPLPDVAWGDPPFTVPATVDSGLALDFGVGATDACTVSGSKVTIVRPGSCTVTASRPGDANHTAASPVARSFTIGPAATTTSVVVRPIASEQVVQFSDSVKLIATVSTAVTRGLEGTVTFRINDSAATEVAVPISGPGPLEAIAKIRLSRNVLPSGAGSYPVTATFEPTPGEPFARSTTNDAVVQVMAEGQLAGGKSDGTASIAYVGPATLHQSTVPTFRAVVRQSQGRGATDRQFVPFSKVPVKAVFKLFRCSTICAAAPVYVSRPTSVAAAAWWSKTGTGTVARKGPATLRAGSYKLTVQLVGAQYLRAATSSTMIRVTTAASVLWEANSGAGIEPSIAVNPFDARLVAMSYQYNFPSGCDFSGVRVSRDGGRTWWTVRSPWTGRCADHHGQVAWGPGRTPGTYRLWAVNALAMGGIYAAVTHSDDLGATWSAPYVERRTPPWVGGYPEITVDTSADSPNFGAVYATYNWLESSHGPGLSVIASGDSGATWQIAKVPRVGLSGYPYSWRIGYRVRTSPSGAVYVSFYESDLRYWSQDDIFNQGSGSNIGRLGYAVAELTFDRAARRLTAAPAVWARSLSRSRITLPFAPQWQSQLDVDAAGNVWLAVADYSSKGYVHVGRSSTRGRTWSWKTIGASGLSLFKPSVAVQGGVVFVGFHSMDSSGRVGTRYTFSYDDGATYLAPRTVTSATWSWSFAAESAGMGFRQNASFGRDGVVRFVYGDGRLGTSRASVYAAGVRP